MKASGSQAPGDGEAIIGDKRADGSGLDRRREQLTEGCVILGDLVEREANRLGDRDPGTLCRGRRTPIAPGESDRAFEHSPKRFYFVFRFRDAFLVLELAGF